MTESNTVNVSALRRNGEMLYGRQLFSDLNGQSFLLKYSLTACGAGCDKNDPALVTYGIKVNKYSMDSKGTLIDTADATHVTTSLDTACEIIDILVRNAVTPISLHDVISDILLDKSVNF
jgi:hypothetical protein